MDVLLEWLLGHGTGNSEWAVCLSRHGSALVDVIQAFVRERGVRAALNEEIERLARYFGVDV